MKKDSRKIMIIFFVTFWLCMRSDFLRMYQKWYVFPSFKIFTFFLPMARRSLITLGS
jgi:hypothetical protein